MAKQDYVTETPPFRTDYQLVRVEPDEFQKRVKPKQFISLDQQECILCEGCVDICPWKCIHMLDTGIISDAAGIEMPGTDPQDHVVFVIDEDECTRCALCVDRCPTGVIVLGKMGDVPAGAGAQGRNNNHGYAYGMRF
jgi:ferredoxin